MAAPLGQRTYRLVILSVLCGTLLYGLALFFTYLIQAPPPPGPPGTVQAPVIPLQPIIFLYIGLGIGFMIGLATTPGAGSLIMQWWARSKDSSSIVEQMREDKTKAGDGREAPP